MNEKKISKFMEIVHPFMTQALILMGALKLPDMKTEIDFEGAKKAIDLLEYFKEITKGNLTEDENKTLTEILMNLQQLYIEENKKHKKTNTKEEEK